MNRSKHGLSIRLVVSAALFAVTSAQAAQSTMPAHTVRVAAGRLSVDVRDAVLVDLLAEVGRQAGFAVAPCAACAQTVSQRFNRLPLAQALVLILRDQDFVLHWKTAPAGGLVPKHVQVLPPAGAHWGAFALRAAVRAPSERPRGAHAADPQASRLLSVELSIGTPESREQAVADLAQPGRIEAVAPLKRALVDSDTDVRRAAIDSLAAIGGLAAADALALALRDADPRLREAAVDALGDIGGSKAIGLLRQAQGDSSEFVRQAAAEVLDDLTAPRVERKTTPGAKVKSRSVPAQR